MEDPATEAGAQLLRMVLAFRAYMACLVRVFRTCAYVYRVEQRRTWPRPTFAWMSSTMETPHCCMESRLRGQWVQFAAFHAPLCELPAAAEQLQLKLHSPLYCDCTCEQMHGLNFQVCILCNLVSFTECPSPSILLCSFVCSTRAAPLSWSTATPTWRRSASWGSSARRWPHCPAAGSRPRTGAGA